jgi:hypothetical protein
VTFYFWFFIFWGRGFGGGKIFVKKFAPRPNTKKLKKL